MLFYTRKDLIQVDNIVHGDLLHIGFKEMTIYIKIFIDMYFQSYLGAIFCSF